MIKKTYSHISVFLVICTIVVSSGCAIKDTDIMSYTDGRIIIGEHMVAVDVASTAGDRARGLGGRNELCGTCGMLFVFDDVSVRHFWMKEMMFDIDVVWIADDRIIGISERVTHSEQEQSVFVSPAPVNRVLELPAGYIADRGVSIGQKVTYVEGIFE